MSLTKNQFGSVFMCCTEFVQSRLLQQPNSSGCVAAGQRHKWPQFWHNPRSRASFNATLIHTICLSSCPATP